MTGNHSNIKTIRANLLLLFASIIWGISFVAQVSGMDHLGPFTFNGIRLIIGGFTLIPVIKFFDKKKSGKTTAIYNKGQHIRAGLIMGCLLFIASSLQQMGMQYTTAGKAGFITTIYVVFVPIFGFIFLKKKAPILVWISVAIAITGLYMLSIKSGSENTISKGDLLVLISAVVFAIHILVIAHFAPKLDGTRLSAIQFFVAGVVSVVIAGFTENISLELIINAGYAILYSGVLSAGVAYTLQIVAMKDTDPTIASLILSLESVFAVLAGAIILGESLTTREIWGCTIMFLAILLSQLSGVKKIRRLSDKI